jgi:hypothetical protein
MPMGTPTAAVVAKELTALTAGPAGALMLAATKGGPAGGWVGPCYGGGAHGGACGGASSSTLILTCILCPQKTFIHGSPKNRRIKHQTHQRDDGF